MSCQTIPRIPDAFAIDARFVPLNPGASIYLFANVIEARQIIDLLPIEELKDNQTAQMLDRTDFITAAMFPPESGQRFQLAAWGSYPSSLAGMAFRMDSAWQNIRSETRQTYWFSSVNKLSISITSKQAFVAASLKEDPFDPLPVTPGKEIPEGFNAFRLGNSFSGAPLSFWLENPGPVVSRIFSQAGFQIPIQQLFVNLFPVRDNQYEAALRIQFENVSHARGMAAILNLAGNFSANDPVARLFLANPPVQNGRFIDIKTALMSERELISLLNIFLF
jgi:hypothetical protein